MMNKIRYMPLRMNDISSFKGLDGISESTLSLLSKNFVI